MTSYVNRTCHICGIRKPQPEMHQEEVYVETGKSKAGVSGATWTGALLGNQKSVNSINRWLFNTNQRTYMRKKIVWMCDGCVPNVKIKDKSKSEHTFIGWVFVIFVFILVTTNIGDNKPKITPNQNTTQVKNTP
jgi:hypothetical protein